MVRHRATAQCSSSRHFSCCGACLTCGLVPAVSHLYVHTYNTYRYTDASCRAELLSRSRRCVVEKRSPCYTQCASVNQLAFGSVACSRPSYVCRGWRIRSRLIDARLVHDKCGTAVPWTHLSRLQRRRFRFGLTERCHTSPGCCSGAIGPALWRDHSVNRAPRSIDNLGQSTTWSHFVHFS